MEKVRYVLCLIALLPMNVMPPVFVEEAAADQLKQVFEFSVLMEWAFEAQQWPHLKRISNSFSVKFNCDFNQLSYSGLIFS